MLGSFDAAIPYRRTSVSVACDAAGKEESELADSGLYHTAGNEIELYASAPAFTSSDAGIHAEEDSGEDAGPGQHFVF